MVAESERVCVSMRMKTDSTVNGAGLLTAGAVAYGAAQWGVLVLVARMGSQHDVGLLALALAVAAPIDLLARMQLRTIEATDGTWRFSLSDFVHLRITASLAAGILAVALAALAYRSEVVAVVALVATAKGAEGISDIIQGGWQRLERFGAVAASYGVKALSTLAGVYLAYGATHTAVGAALGLAVGWAAALILFDIPVNMRHARRPAHAPRTRAGVVASRRLRLRTLARLAAPLGLAATLVSLRVNVPRYVVEGAVGTADLGAFAALAYLVVIGGRVVQAIGQAITPRLGRHFAAGESRDFGRLMGRFVAVVGAVGVGGLVVGTLFGRELLAAIYGPSYSAYHVLLMWLLAYGILEYVSTALQSSLIAARTIDVQPAVLVVSVAMVLVLSLLLVPRLGLIGAAIALLASGAYEVGAWSYLYVRARSTSWPELSVERAVT